MSLLLDALKRAEQEKLARRGSDGQGAGEPESRSAPGESGGLELESRPSTASTSPHQPATQSSATARDREAARTVFAAKLSDSNRGGMSGRNKALVGIGVGALALFAAGGAYVWYEINKTPALMARAPLPAAPPKPLAPVSPAAVAPAGITSPGAPGGDATPGSGTTAGAATPPTGPAAAVPPVSVLKPEKLAAETARPKPKPKPSEQLVMNLLKDSASAKPRPPLKLSRTIEAPRVSPDVRSGYDALLRGDIPAARKSYESAVAADASSLDAHLGLATAAARMGDRETATRHYRRALALEPKNPSAIAGLASLVDLNRPDGLEAQLRADITRYPQSPALHFTLGNLYASQTRWTEAQAAYFEAFHLDPDGADLAYNLAVSLDHLGQKKLAADFYRRALSSAAKQSAQFDSGQVSRRLAELQR